MAAANMAMILCNTACKKCQSFKEALPSIDRRTGKGARVRLITRNFADRFPVAAAPIAAAPGRPCVVDDEAIACADKRLAVLDLIRGPRRNERVVLSTFDLLELDGEDMRWARIEVRGAIW